MSDTRSRHRTDAGFTLIYETPRQASYSCSRAGVGRRRCVTTRDELVELISKHRESIRRDGERRPRDSVCDFCIPRNHPHGSETPPVLSLMTANFFPDNRDLFPCYGPCSVCPAFAALLLQAIENRGFIAVTPNPRGAILFFSPLLQGKQPPQRISEPCAMDGSSRLRARSRRPRFRRARWHHGAFRRLRLRGDWRLRRLGRRRDTND